MVMRIDDDNDELAEGGRQVGDMELCLGRTIIHCDQKYLLRRCHHCPPAHLLSVFVFEVHFLANMLPGLYFVHLTSTTEPTNSA